MLIPLRKSFSDLLRASWLLMIAGCLAGVAWAAASINAAGSAPQPASSTTILKCEAIPSAILGRSVNTCVALPSDYDSATGKRYPLLYFLHGLFEDEKSWSERGGQEILDGLLSDGEVGKFIVVMPDGGRSFYVNSKDGQERW